MNARERANAEQRQASDPLVSAFVAASAGSGKTKLLTDRLLRLMLSGADPARILCLTFTKAAAAEMALRLQRTLGRWVTLPDPALDHALDALDVQPTPQIRANARALFARVLDLPGGMRIGTIHAFCQSLLRRFPLEASISPHFEVVEDRDAEEKMREAREAMLAMANSPAQRSALETLAGLATVIQFGQLTACLGADRIRIQNALALGPGLADAQRRALGLTAPNRDSLLAGAVTWADEGGLLAAARRVAERGSPKCAERAQRMLDWLGLDPERRARAWQDWRETFLTRDGKPRANGGYVNADLARRCPDLGPLFAAEAERIVAVEESCRAADMAEASAALLTLAAPVLAGYGARKETSGLLDYDDLIGRTSALLVDPGAAWVLYKLDGGLDHLLLDEVQDTAPAQWEIAHALTDEFFAGQGAREQRRTVFAVGDGKQSIYSFQGADIGAFEASHARLALRVRAAGLEWRDAELDVSFRSTAPVLALVDRVFENERAAAGVVEPGKTLKHFADRAGHAGSVELWPLAPAPDMPDPPPWTIPDRNLGTTSAPQLLAEALATWIRDQTGGATILESRARPLAPGDVMVLARRRNEFARALVRALKARGVPVAGLDRLVLTEQPAVQDLMALVDTLLLPQDDLSLACVLTSPLGGVCDESLMDLAAERRGRLWDTLRARAAERSDWRAAWNFLSTLLSRVDYASPHALLAEALGPLGGRTRLYARLGPEAAEPVDELLNAALAYARTHPASLQGFLHWLRQSGAEVKREAEGAGGMVRVMTVHGAKGLQAPVVILPDTTALPPDDGPLLWGTDPLTGIEVPLWSPRKELRCAAAETLRSHARARRMDEHNRLLYVALTRAEDRLVICGWQTRNPPPDECWYNLVLDGFARLPDTSSEPFRDWGELLRHVSPQLAEPERSSRMQPLAAQPLPAWAGAAPDWRPVPPPAEPERSVPLAPSRPEGVSLGPVPSARSPLAAREQQRKCFRRGQLIHALLQYLPEIEPSRRAAAARAWLDRPGHELPEGAAEVMAREVLGILAHPELAPLFGAASRAEAPLTGLVGGVVIGGMVDRLAVLPDRVLVADYKTSREPPETEAKTPVRYLRQMAAYRAVLRGIFPGRPIVCVLVWTETAQVSLLSDAALDGHEPGAALPVAQDTLA
ncbi:MAG: double-strand break repair helicase AddA [Acetobacteraceae bacterium]|nr:double-strand break repair helicase AddA [Acetobacteraceae bacterium]